MSNYKAEFIKKIPKLSINGKNVIEARYNLPKAITKDKIQDFANNFKNELLKKGMTGSLSVATKEAFGWRSSKLTDINLNVQVYKLSDYYDVEEDQYDDDITSFSIYLYQGYNPAGGEDDNNDCLFNCMSQFFGGKVPYYETPEKLKSFLKLNRNDLIPIKLMSRIETAYRININVFGDFTYKSEEKRQKTLNLYLSKSHYTIKKNEKNNHLKNIKRDWSDYIPLIYRMNKNEVEVYDKGGIMKSTHENFVKFRYEYFDKYKFINIKKSKLPLGKEFENYNFENEQIFKMSKGIVNMKNYINVKGAALDLFVSMSQDTRLPSEIDQIESEFILNSYGSGLVDSFPGKYDNCYQYDQNSQYASALIKIMFPMSCGKYEKINDFPVGTSGFVKYGFYRCKITVGNKRTLFYENKNDYYTHYDIMSAQLQNMSICLIQDDQPNALLYDDLEYGSKMFTKFVNFLYDLKTKKCILAKKLLVTLPGALNEKNIKTIYVGDKEIDINHKKIHSLYPLGEEKYVLKEIPNNKYFLTNYARMGPFLTSYCRYNMAKLLNDNVKSIVRIHTDGFISLKPLDFIPIGPELGKFKLEQENKTVNIKNKIVVKWEK